MYTLKTFSFLAIAATTVLAAPTPVEDVNALEARGGYQWRGGNRFWQRPNGDAYVTVTGYGDAAPAEETAAPVAEPTNAWTPPAPAETTAAPVAVETPAYTPPAVVEAPAANGWGQQSAPAAQPSAEPEAPAASSAPASVSSGGDWFDIANKWRVAGGLSPFTEDSTLVANAKKTADASVGGLTHQLNPGTFAQVLAPGDSSNFESVYVGGWLCELPNSKGLNGICSTASNGWNHEGQTGHAEILQGDYKKIGCALSGSTGVWSCDLA